MSTFKEKSKGFIVGILVGVIVAGGFFILKLDNYFKELNFYKSIVKSFSSESKTNEQDVKKTLPILSPKNSNKSRSKKSSIITNDTDLSKEESSDIANLSLEDSVVKENIISEDIVRKDELITTKTLDVINLNPPTNKSKDSLLQKVSGIKEENSTGKQLLNIEFWSSPLNYKGYKLSKYKVILYGFSSPEGMKLFKIEDVIYLKNAGIVYRMDYSGEFRPYEKVVDESILEKLK